MLEHPAARDSKSEPRRERGFALLLVFALAASVAILIYLEIPRVAFERQRDKEALLIDRGEQYARAIELYARAMKKYPQTLDDLEKSQTVRFLRRRYKDPMSGKDEWRLVHMGPNGQYLDSKIHQLGGAQDKEDSGPGVLASKIQGVGQSATVISQEGQPTSAALQKRGSDRITPGSTPGAGPGEQGQNGSPDASQDPNQPQNNAAQPGQPQGTPPGTPANSARFPFPGQTNDAQQQGGTQNNSNPALGTGQPLGAQGGTDNTGANPGSSTQPQAMQAIQSILGGQRSGSTTGTGGQTGSTTGGPAGIGGASPLGPGLAGVATTVEMEGIRRYKDHSNYSEWEFVYDPRDVQAQGQGAGNQPTGTGSNGTGAAPGASFGGMPGGTPAPPSSPPRN